MALMCYLNIMKKYAHVVVRLARKVADTQMGRKFKERLIEKYPGVEVEPTDMAITDSQSCPFIVEYSEEPVAQMKNSLIPDFSGSSPRIKISDLKRTFDKMRMKRA